MSLLWWVYTDNDYDHTTSVLLINNLLISNNCILKIEKWTAETAYIFQILYRAHKSGIAY